MVDNLSELDRVLGRVKCSILDSEQENTKLKAEVERLREALGMIVFESEYNKQVIKLIDDFLNNKDDESFKTVEVEMVLNALKEEINGL